jgi:hypothetical protein
MIEPSLKGASEVRRAFLPYVISKILICDMRLIFGVV